MKKRVLETVIAFFLPSQLGAHYWPSQSRVAGIKIDYLSPTLYFVDVLLLMYVLLSYRLIIAWIKRNKTLIALAIAFIIINIAFSESLANSSYWWARSVLYVLVGLSFYLNKIDWNQIKNPIVLSCFLILALQIVQLVTGKSVEGLLYLFGERKFSEASVGLAYATLSNNYILRAPAIFSHPNSLAGYMVVVYYLLQTQKSPMWQRYFVFTSILLTFSKSGLLALALVLLFKLNPKKLILASITLSLVQIFFAGISINISFISDRLFLLRSTATILENNPIFGVGLGNYVVSLGGMLPGSHLLISKLQPVHNLPYLIWAEIGLVGITFIISLLYHYQKKLNSDRIFKLFAIIAIIGCFDHYFWTLPQNRLIAVLAIALMI